MSFTDLTCFAGELCLYMSTLGFVVSLFGETRNSLLYLALGLIAGAGCMLAQKARGALRFLPLLLFAPAFLLARDLASAVLPVPVLLLMLLRARRRSWRGDHELVKKLFKVGIVVYPLLLGFIALAELFNRFLADTLPLFVVWLLLTVFNLRLLRNSDTANFGGQFRVLNAAMVLGVALVGFLLGTDLAVTAFLTLIRLIYSYVIGPLFFVALCIFTVVPAALGYLFGLLMRLMRGLLGSQEVPEMDLAGFAIEFPEYDGSATESSVWLQRAAAAVLVILFLLIVFFIVRKLVSRRKAPPRPPRTLERESVAVKTGRRRGYGNSPAERVRAAYRKYLVLCGGLNIPVDGSAASDVIRDSSAPYTGEEDTQALREVWLRARFSGGEITDAEAKGTRQMVRRMKSSAEKTRRGEKQK